MKTRQDFPSFCQTTAYFMGVSYPFMRILFCMKNRNYSPPFWRVRCRYSPLCSRIPLDNLSHVFRPILGDLGRSIESNRKSWFTSLMLIMWYDNNAQNKIITILNPFFMLLFQSIVSFFSYFITFLHFSSIFLEFDFIQWK